MRLGSEEVSVWLDSAKYDALQRALAEHDGSIEQELQERLEDAYRELVPADEQAEIELFLRAERQKAAENLAASRRYTVYRVTENGRNSFFESEQTMPFPQLAGHLRRYLRGELAPGEDFSQRLHGSAYLNADTYDTRITAFMDGDPHIAGVYDINLTREICSVLDRSAGWQEYDLKDISAAIYHAQRKDSRSVQEVERIFCEHLEGKELGQQYQGPTMQM